MICQLFIIGVLACGFVALLLLLVSDFIYSETATAVIKGFAYLLIFTQLVSLFGAAYCIL